MSVTLSRVSLFEALAHATRVADKNSPLAAAKFARLEAKAADRTLMVTTFNGQTAVESVLAGDVADDLLVYVDAQTLYKLVSAMPEGAITLAMNGNGVSMTTGDGKFKNDLKIGADIEIPVIAGSSRTEMARIAGVEVRRLARAVKFASSEDAKPALMTVHVGFNKVEEKVIAVASATDGFAAVQSLAPVISCSQAAVEKGLTFTAPFMSLILEAVRPDDQVTVYRSGESRFIIAVTNDKSGKNLALASTESSVVTPVEQIAAMIKSTKSEADVTFEVDTASLENALDIIGAYSGDNSDLAYVFLSIHNGMVYYASNPTGNGQCRPSILDGTAAGPNTSRWFNPNMVRRAADLMPEKTKASMPSKPKTPILLMGDNIRVMIAPMDNTALKDIKVEEATAVELPMEQPILAAVAA